MKISKIKMFSMMCFAFMTCEALAETNELSLQQLQAQFDSQVAAGEGNAAYATLLRVLEVDPDNVPAKRLLLELYVQNQKWNDAQKIAIELMYDDPQNRRGYQNVYNRISGLKPFNISGGFSIAPSTNVNSGTSEDTFDTFFGVGQIDEDSKAKSGYGIQANLNGYFKSQINPQNTLRLDWSLYGVRYPKHEDLNSYVFTTKLSYAHSFKNKSGISLGLERTEKWSGASSQYEYLGQFVNLSTPIGSKTRLGANVRVGKYDYTSADYLDGKQKNTPYPSRTALVIS